MKDPVSCKLDECSAVPRLIIQRRVRREIKRMGDDPIVSCDNDDPMAKLLESQTSDQSR